MYQFFCFLFFLTTIFGLDKALDRLEETLLDQDKIAIVQFSYDGVNTENCGVGTVVLQTQEILKELNARYQNCFKLYLLSANYAEDLPEYSAKVLEVNRKNCLESNGEVYLIPISKNNEMFGNPEQWQELCDQGADICISIINSNKQTIILAHDTAYAQIPLKISERTKEIKKPYQALWIPHGTSWKYNGHTTESQPNWPERHEWELKALKMAKGCGYKVGYISPTIQQDLSSAPFYADPSILIPYYTGILMDRFVKAYSQEEIGRELKKRNIPLDKRLIFSIGRATPLKGHDITLEMYRHLKCRYPDIHLVLLAPPSDYMPEYLGLLQKRIEEEKLEVTLIDHFDSEIGPYIYQWDKTEMLSLLSRMDTQPLTVMEGRANPGRCVLLTSSSERSGNQVEHGKDGFMCSLDGLDQIISKPVESSESMEQIVAIASEILDLSSDKRNAIIESGKKLIFEKYNLRTNVVVNFSVLLNTITSPLVFEELKGGVVNPPLLVSSEEGAPKGVLKGVSQDKESAAFCLKILSEIRESGFSHLPQIFKNKEGAFLTDFRGRLSYFMEYLPPDHAPITTREMLEVTGEFHRVTCHLEELPFLKKTKWEEFVGRISCFDDPWFAINSPQIFSGYKWGKIRELGHYFASESFKKIYESLPKQLVHGDNNQTNVVKSGGNLFLVDFDALRVDTRLIDLASYFRYGGFEDYMRFVKDDELNKIVNNFYGVHAGVLSPLEESALPSIVLFSHVEVVSWLMERLKYAAINHDRPMVEQFMALITEYECKILKIEELVSR